MKAHLKLPVALSVLMALVWSIPAQAGLIVRLGGAVVYDTDLNITWLSDANYAKTLGYTPGGGVTMRKRIISLTC